MKKRYPAQLDPDFVYKEIYNDLNLRWMDRFKEKPISLREITKRIPKCPSWKSVKQEIIDIETWRRLN